MAETDIHLFTYGTLMVPEIMAQISGCRSRSLAAVLKGAARFGIRGEEYPGVIRQAGQEVNGVLYLDLPPSAFSRLDLFEGEYYRRETVEVVCCDGGQILPAMVYIFRRQYRHLLTGQPWDYQAFLARGRSVFECGYAGYLHLDGE